MTEHPFGLSLALKNIQKLEKNKKKKEGNENTSDLDVGSHFRKLIKWPELHGYKSV